MVQKLANSTRGKRGVSKHKHLSRGGKGQRGEQVGVYPLEGKGGTLGHSCLRNKKGKEVSTLGRQRRREKYLIHKD